MRSQTVEAFVKEFHLLVSFLVLKKILQFVDGAFNDLRRVGSHLTSDVPEQLTCLKGGGSHPLTELGEFGHAVKLLAHELLRLDPHGKQIDDQSNVL